VLRAHAGRVQLDLAHSATAPPTRSGDA
jgi:hypothetical protein